VSEEADAKRGGESLDAGRIIRGFEMDFLCWAILFPWAEYRWEYCAPVAHNCRQLWVDGMSLQGFELKGMAALQSLTRFLRWEDLAL
jgi:hypothetical protein